MIYNRFKREISCHHITISLHNRITASLCQSVICLAPCHQTSQSFALPPATKPVSHLPCPLPPHHRVTTSPHHCVSQSFALPPATKPVSHLPCPLPPNQSFALPPTTVSPHHCATASPCHRVSQSFALSLPPSQSVIYLAPCHQASHSFALPPATKPVSHLPCPLPPCHRVTASPCHRITTSPC